MALFKSKKDRPGASAAGRDAQSENRKTAYVFKGVFNLATLISDFDLRLAFLGKRIRGTCGEISAMFADVASSSEEISVSTSQIVGANARLSETIGQVSQDAASLSAHMNAGNEILQGIYQENTEMMAVSRTMAQSLEELLSVIRKINESVKGINKISDQTKLLSLNASIEAAKAGAAGRGFAVVADEIRTLSESTKALTGSIDALLEEVDEASGRSKSSVEKTIASIDKISGGIQEAARAMSQSMQASEEIARRILDVAESSGHISEALQESSAALESVNQEIQGLSRASDELEGISAAIDEVSVSLGKIGDEVSHVAGVAGELSGSRIGGLTNEDFIEAVEKAIAAHTRWVANLKNMASSMEVAPIQTDEHKCGFGHFYYAVKPTSDKLTQLWDSVESVHHELHQTGDVVIELVQKGKADTAMARALEAEKLSLEIIRRFNKMIDITRGMSLKGESVF